MKNIPRRSMAAGCENIFLVVTSGTGKLLPFQSWLNVVERSNLLCATGLRSQWTIGFVISIQDGCATRLNSNPLQKK